MVGWLVTLVFTDDDRLFPISLCLDRGGGAGAYGQRSTSAANIANSKLDSGVWKCVYRYRCNEFTTRSSLDSFWYQPATAFLTQENKNAFPMSVKWLIIVYSGNSVLEVSTLCRSLHFVLFKIFILLVFICMCIKKDVVCGAPTSYAKNDKNDNIHKIHKNGKHDKIHKIH